MANADGAGLDLYQLTAGLGSADLIDAPIDFNEQLPESCLLSVHGIRLTKIGRGSSVAEMTVKPSDLNQRGIAQAGALVALADAAAGWASYSAIEHGRFTTVNLTTSLLSAAREGDFLCATATPVRIGRKVHVLDVAVHAQAGPGGSSSAKLIAQFGCTQLVLEPVAQQGGK